MPDQRREGGGPSGCPSHHSITSCSRSICPIRYSYASAVVMPFATAPYMTRRSPSLRCQFHSSMRRLVSSMMVRPSLEGAAGDTRLSPWLADTRGAPRVVEPHRQIASCTVGFIDCREQWVRLRKAATLHAESELVKQKRVRPQPVLKLVRLLP